MNSETSLKNSVQWKRIPGFKRYIVSDSGLIASTNYKNTQSTRILRPAKNKDGYLKTLLKGDDGKYRSIFVHKMVAITFLHLETGMNEVNHINGIKTDNRLTNLEYCTRGENIKHAYKCRLISPKIGSKNGRSKLSEQSVLEIRERASELSHYGRKSMAEMYNVTESTIKDIVSRRRNAWSHV